MIFRGLAEERAFIRSMFYFKIVLEKPKPERLSTWTPLFWSCCRNAFTEQGLDYAVGLFYEFWNLSWFPTVNRWLLLSNLYASPSGSNGRVTQADLPGRLCQTGVPLSRGTTRRVWYFLASSYSFPLLIFLYFYLLTSFFHFSCFDIG